MEEWRDVKGYEGLYQVSNMGRVKSLGNGNSNNSKEKILKPGKDKKGYLIVIICKNGKRKTCKVHRIVAEAFIPNYDNKYEIDHINCIRDDNRVKNIRLCSHKENMNNPKTIKCESECHKGNRNKLSKKVICIEINEIFNSTGEAARELGINKSHISDCCNGKRKTTGGYHWKYI